MPLAEDMALFEQVQVLHSENKRLRDSTIEECAQVAENCVHPVMDVVVAERYRYVAAAIRALKDKS